MTGEQIKALRKKHKMTLYKLSQKIGVVPSTIYSWENNVHPISKRYIPRIRAIFNIQKTDEERREKWLERKEIRDALADIGDERIAHLDDNDPRLIRLQKAMGVK